MSRVKRAVRRAKRRAVSWGTVISLTLQGNKVEKLTNLRGSSKPVLLLYGFGATRRTFSILERRLRKDGYAVFSIKLGGFFDTFNTHCIEDLAELVDQKVEKLYKKYNIKSKLSVIGHSKGGLIGRYYVKRLAGEERVKALITLGTPHHGNPWAMLAYFNPVSVIFPSVRQMAPISKFMRSLKKGPWPKNVRLVSIFSKDDKVCPHPNAVLLETKAKNIGVINIEAKNISHSEFLIKKSVYTMIKHALQNTVPESAVYGAETPAIPQSASDPLRLVKEDIQKKVK